MTWEPSNVGLKHLGHPLVVGFSTGQKILHLHYIREDMSQNKNPKHSSNLISKRWVLSFLVVHSTCLCWYAENKTQSIKEICGRLKKTIPCQLCCCSSDIIATALSGLTGKNGRMISSLKVPLCVSETFTPSSSAALLTINFPPFMHFCFTHL